MKHYCTNLLDARDEIRWLNTLLRGLDSAAQDQSQSERWRARERHTAIKVRQEVRELERQWA